MPELGTYLLWLARASIARALAQAEPAPPPLAAADAPLLAQPAASFVTLNRAGVLRGCIGSLVAHRSLAEDIASNAVAAAFRDPRFPPLRADELADLHVEVSLLTPPEPFSVRDESEALQQLRPDVDGVIFTAGQHRATFLPQVWAQLPDPAEFLAQLKRKAGLPGDYWGSDVTLARYTVKKWKEA